MLNADYFKAHKIDSDSLKAWFSNKANEGKAQKILDRVNLRARDGIDRSIKSHNIYWAIDKAFDVSFSQTSATLVRSLMSYKPDDQRVLNAVKEWELDNGDIWCNECNPDGTHVLGKDGKPKKILNIPAFVQIFVPIVKAYTTIRWAKLFSDRDLVPLFKYEPARSTELNRLRCEILTDRVQFMATQLGYRATLRQAILQTVMYGICIQFPKEAWFTRKQGKMLAKEGLRYHMPHPTRMYWDLAHRPSTMNSDSGCRFAGYWEIVPYGELKDNKSLWNTEKISFGERDWVGGNKTYFTQVYPCQMTYPLKSAQGTGGVADNDREQQQEYYTTDWKDKAVMNSTHFELLNPKDEGISDLDEPVWFRFMMANEVTPLFIEPMPCSPAIYYGYDADENRTKNTSLALEALPFQDQVSNILSQLMAAVRQNLRRVVFFDSGQVSQSDIEKIKANANKNYTEYVWIGYNAKEKRFAEEKPGEAFTEVNFAAHNTYELITAIKTVLDILERVLVMSSQEVAQAATHEQTAEETRAISSTTSTRVSHTGGFIDDAIYAWKHQLYMFLMAFGSDDIYAQIPADTEITKETLEKLGFTFEDEEDSGKNSKEDRLKRPISGKKEKLLMLEGFSSVRDSKDRVDNAALAGQMIQMLNIVGSNQPLLEQLGAKQIVALVNQIMTVAGMPRDFRLKLDSNGNQGSQEMQNQIVELAKQVAEAIKQSEQKTGEFVQSSLTQALQPMAEKLQPMMAAAQAVPQIAQETQQLAQETQQINDAITQLSEAVKQVAAEGAATQQAVQVMAQQVDEISNVQVLHVPEGSAQPQQAP